LIIKAESNDISFQDFHPIARLGRLDYRLLIMRYMPMERRAILLGPAL